MLLIALSMVDSTGILGVVKATYCVILYKLSAELFYLSVPYNFIRYRKVSQKKFVLQVELMKLESHLAS